MSIFFQITKIVHRSNCTTASNGWNCVPVPISDTIELQQFAQQDAKIRHFSSFSRKEFLVFWFKPFICKILIARMTPSPTEIEIPERVYKAVAYTKSKIT